MKPPALWRRPWAPTLRPQGCLKLSKPEVAGLDLRLLNFFKQQFSTKAASLSLRQQMGLVQGQRGLWPRLWEWRLLTCHPSSVRQAAVAVGPLVGPFPSWHGLHLPRDAGLLWGFSGL